MKKKLIISIFPLLGLISCTKTNVADKPEEIATINFVNPASSDGSSIADCGTCPGHITVGYPLQVPDGPFYCLRSTTSLCGIDGPNYRSTNTDPEGGFEGSFQNVNGKLQMTVEKSSLPDDKRLLYFSNDQFVFDRPEYMSDVLLLQLGLPTHYLINAGSHKITSENGDQFTILL